LDTWKGPTMGRKAGKLYKSIEKFEDLYEHPKKSHRDIAKSLFKLQPASTKMIAADTGYTIQTVRATISNFRDFKVIYVVYWAPTKGSSKLPFYQVGGEPDLIRKTDHAPHANKPKKKVAAKRIQIWETDESLLDIARALVPSRTKEEVKEINRLYLNWISEGAYG